MSPQVAWEDERGFTLIEVTTVVIILGIVLAIAAPSWFGVVESRQVDSATNQMVSELRRAHTSSTNRLEDWKVDLQANSGTYQIGPCPDPDNCAPPLDPAAPLTSELSLEEGVEVQPSDEGMVEEVVFEANGEAQITGAAGADIRISAEDDVPCYEIEINELTSKINVMRPDDCV